MEVSEQPRALPATYEATARLVRVRDGVRVRVRVGVRARVGVRVGVGVRVRIMVRGRVRVRVRLLATLGDQGQGQG